MAKVQVKDVYSGKRGWLSDSEYNQAMGEWSRTVQRLAKTKASAFSKGKRRNRIYLSGPKAGKREGKLKNHIQFQLKSDAGEVAGVAFQFPVHGIFREYGVGNGSPRSHVSRSMSDWLSGTLAKQEGNLISIVAEHQGDKVVRTFMGIKK